MNAAYWSWVERTARDCVDQLRTGRRATFRAPAQNRDVVRRVEQLLRGDETPPYGDPSDE